MIREFAISVAPTDRTLPRLLNLQAARHGDRVLFSCAGEVMTFANAPGIAARTAGALHAAGVRPGDRVAILCSNRPELLRVVLGCGWLGAIAVPINTAAKGPQLHYALENSAARLLILEDALQAVLDHCPLEGLPLERVQIIGEGGPALECSRPMEAFVGEAAPDTAISPFSRT